MVCYKEIIIFDVIFTFSVFDFSKSEQVSSNFGRSIFEQGRVRAKTSRATSGEIFISGKFDPSNFEQMFRSGDQFSSMLEQCFDLTCFVPNSTCLLQIAIFQLGVDEFSKTKRQ